MIQSTRLSRMVDRSDPMRYHLLPVEAYGPRVRRIAKPAHGYGVFSRLVREKGVDRRLFVFVQLKDLKCDNPNPRSMSPIFIGHRAFSEFWLLQSLLLKPNGDYPDGGTKFAVHFQSSRRYAVVMLTLVEISTYSSSWHQVVTADVKVTIIHPRSR